jgi:hypothetical protein
MNRLKWAIGGGIAVYFIPYIITFVIIFLFAATELLFKWEVVEAAKMFNDATTTHAFRIMNGIGVILFVLGFTGTMSDNKEYYK